MENLPFNKLTPGQRLRQTRKDQGLTLKALAELADVHFSTIQKIEKGESENFTWKLREKIAHALNVNFWEIWSEEFQEAMKEKMEMEKAYQLDLMERAKEKGRYKKPKDERELIATEKETEKMEGK